MKNVGNEYSWQGMLIISVLGIVGGAILFFTGCFNISNYDDLYRYVSVHGLEAIFSLFFIGVDIYCWGLFFRNVVIKPKKEILYLLKIEDGIATFINKNGKTFFIADCKFVPNKFYYVLKTHDYIKEVLNESLETFVIKKEKRSYWLNLYSPMGNFENIFLLPIVYVILLPGILSIIMSEEFQKIYGIIWSVVPGYIISYDLIYKIKLRKNDSVLDVDDGSFNMSFFSLINIIKLVSVIVINVILIWIFVSCSDNISRLIASPFCACGLCSLGHVISEMFNNDRMKKVFEKSYIIIFLMFWFGFLVFYTIGIIKQEGSYFVALYTIPFWIAGFFLVYKNLIKKD